MSSLQFTLFSPLRLDRKNGQAWLLNMNKMFWNGQHVWRGIPLSCVTCTTSRWVRFLENFPMVETPISMFRSLRDFPLRVGNYIRPLVHGADFSSCFLIKNVFSQPLVNHRAVWMKWWMKKVYFLNDVIKCRCVWCSWWCCCRRTKSTYIDWRMVNDSSNWRWMSVRWLGILAWKNIQKFVFFFLFTTYIYAKGVDIENPEEEEKKILKNYLRIQFFVPVGKDFRCD